VLSRLYRARLKLRVALGTADVADGTSAVRTIKATVSGGGVLLVVNAHSSLLAEYHR
jgi:hypothetical protein